MRQEKGIALVELVLFLVVVSLALLGIASILSTVVTQGSELDSSSQSLFAAQARMELIVAAHQQNPHIAPSDPCLQIPPPTVCPILTDITVSTEIEPLSLANFSGFYRVSVQAYEKNLDSKVRLQCILGTMV